MSLAPSWPQLAELIQELRELSSVPGAETEPSLAAATLAVTKAAAALTRAAAARSRDAERTLDQALETVDLARGAVAQARLALVAGPRRSGRGAAGSPAAAAVDGKVEGSVESTCPACHRAFVVRYRAAHPEPRIAFPVACPGEGCDGVAEVDYPASAIEVDVETAST